MFSSSSLLIQPLRIRIAQPSDLIKIMSETPPCAGYPEDTLRSLAHRLPCREVQLKSLLSLMGQPDQYSYPSIFIYGHRATGKSHVVLSIMKDLELPHASVNCVECVSSGLLFHQVLSAFSGADAAALLPRCPSLSDFVRLYKQASSGSPAAQTRYIILDRAERMRDMDFGLLPALLRLQELVNDNVTVILLSEIVWEKFRPNTGCFEPLLFNFPDYSKAELVQILSQDHHPSYTPELYASYVNILLGVFFSVCRDLRELRHLAALNFSKFCEPLEKGEAKESDIHKLWKNIEPHLQRAMQTVYLREVSSMQWEQQQMDEKEATTLRGLSAHAHIELPYYSKFLLIAAYLASFNPARTDRRFFLKVHRSILISLLCVMSHVITNKQSLSLLQSHGKIRKTNFLKKHEKTSNHLLGPKPFPLDRLLAIFYSVVDSRVAPTASIFSQISSLVTLQLLSQVGHDDQLDSPKYKCAVSLDFILAISRTVGFDVVKYLYDFL
ncbi:origin recognition complex subunit 5 isoform X2 [Puntigrus tetrazona]|uniref:origin recognition complex subunit 5 isoform X2 n=1 Tax=Puntigrus tetrazona TaxID=1606681 RepID=UPI001C8ACA0A|nr:origin recognition complex subunit 5 isoform X2 [Puntigrus tetrazona]